MSNLLGSMSFTFGSILIVVLLQIVYTIQHRTKDDTTSKLFKILIYCIEFMMVTEIISSFMFYKNVDETISYLFLRFHWTSGIFFFYFLFIYSCALEKDRKDIGIFDYLFKTKKFIPFNIASTILLVLMFIAPVKEIDPNKINYLPLYLSHVVMALLVITTSCQLTVHFMVRAKNFNKTKNKFMFLKVMFEAIPITVQIIFTYLSLAPTVVTFLLVMIYLLIENPDLQVLNELEKEKKLIDESNNFKFGLLSKEASILRLNVDKLYSYVNIDDINAIKNNADLILRQTNDILNYLQSTLDIVMSLNGSNVIECENYNFDELLAKLHSESIVKANEKNIELKFNIDGMTPKTLYGDKNKLYQILRSALNEAINNTNIGKITLTISCSFINDGVNFQIKISDSSNGINKEEYDSLIEKLNNLDNIDNISNTNLNYVIMKKFVTWMNGEMSISSTVGAGTIVSLGIYQKIIDETYIGEINKTIEYFDLSTKKILVVSKNYESISYYLKKYNVLCESVNNIQDCINKFKSDQQYDLLFLDPQIDQNELYPAKSIRNICNTLNAKVPPIVVLSMNSVIGARNKYLSEGFDEYILQPIDEHELQKILRKIN